MQSDSSQLSFGRFRLDPERRVLLADGKPARVGARAIDVLLALVHRRERTVSKNELFDLVWPGQVVEENNLQVHVSALRKLLGAETIVTIPGRGYQFVATLEDQAGSSERAAVASAVPASAPVAGESTNLPASIAPLFGRDDDFAAVCDRLRESAVVTITGAAGIGKTALALAVARRYRGTCADGVWLVEFAALSDPAQSVPLVGHTLGVVGADGSPAAATVAAALRAQSMLLVLDNCEHVLDEVVPLVEALRRFAPDVRVLATSQENLKVAGEQVVRLSPLAVADTDLDIAAQAGAIQLFVARARAVMTDFALTPENLATVAEICRRLDGLPLAIELAAARLPLLGVEGVRARLDERFRVLTAGARLAPRRHQTLQAAFEWSHDLLSPLEQQVFRRLGVFVGGFSLDLAQQVAADERIDEWEVLDHLGVLVDRSLVIVEGSAVPRYHLLESGRAFALEQLDRAGETDALMRRHANALGERMQAFDTTVAHENRFVPELRRLEPELDNLRAALAWATGPSGDRELAVALGAPSDWFWNELELWSEGWQWCQSIRPSIDASIPPALVARFWLTFAGLGRVMMRPAREWIECGKQAAAGFRALGDNVGLYRSLCLLGGQGDAMIPHDDAGAYLEEAARIEDAAWSPRLRLRRQASLEWWYDVGGQLPLSREAGERHLALAREAGGVAEVGALSNLADTEYALGNVERGIELCRASIARAMELGRPSTALHAYGNIVPALLDSHDLQGAADALRAGREAFTRALGTAFMLLPYLPAFAERRGQLQLAARLLGCAGFAYKESGRVMHPPERRACETLMAKLRSSLPERELDELLREGAKWNDDEAFARAGIAVRAP